MNWLSIASALKNLGQDPEDRVPPGFAARVTDLIQAEGHGDAADVSRPAGAVPDLPGSAGAREVADAGSSPVSPEVLPRAERSVKYLSGYAAAAVDHAEDSAHALTSLGMANAVGWVPG